MEENQKKNLMIGGAAAFILIILAFWMFSGSSSKSQEKPKREQQRVEQHARKEPAQQTTAKVSGKKAPKATKKKALSFADYSNQAVQQEVFGWAGVIFLGFAASMIMSLINAVGAWRKSYATFAKSFEKPWVIGTW